MMSGSSRTVRYKFDKDGKMLKRFTWMRSSYNINNHSFEDENFWEEDNPDFTEEEYNDPNFQAYIQAIKDGEFDNEKRNDCFIADEWDERYKSKSFPKGTWTGEFRFENARFALEQLFYEKGINLPEIDSNLSLTQRLENPDIKKILKTKKNEFSVLSGIYQRVPEFESSHVIAIILSFPELGLPEFEFSTSRQGKAKCQDARNYWIQRVRELVEESGQDVIELVGLMDFDKFLGEKYMSKIAKCFSNYYDPFLIEYRELKPWMFKTGPTRIWKVGFSYWSFDKTTGWTYEEKSGEEIAIEATEWLALKLDKISLEEIATIRKDDFEDNGLGGMLVEIYENSVKKALKKAWPDVNENLLNRVPESFWFTSDGEKECRRIIRQVIESAANDGIRLYDIKQEHFDKYHPKGQTMLHKRFDASPSKALAFAREDFNIEKMYRMPSSHWECAENIEKTKIEVRRVCEERGWVDNNGDVLNHEKICRAFPRKWFPGSYLMQVFGDSRPKFFQETFGIERDIWKEVRIRENMGSGYDIEKMVKPYIEKVYREKVTDWKAPYTLPNNRSIEIYMMLDGLEIGIDITDDGGANIKQKWKVRKYHEYLDELWIICTNGLVYDKIPCLGAPSNVKIYTIEEFCEQHNINNKVLDELNQYKESLL